MARPLPPLLPLPQAQHAVVKAALSVIRALPQKARPLPPLLPVPQGQHAVEKAALSVERVLMAVAQKARPRLKPHNAGRLLPERLLTSAWPRWGRRGARLGPWRCLISRGSTGSPLVLSVLFPLSLSIKRACRLPLQALCLATDLLIRVPTSGLGSHRFGTSALRRGSLLTGRGHSEPRNAESLCQVREFGLGCSRASFRLRFNLSNLGRHRCI